MPSPQRSVQIALHGPVEMETCADALRVAGFTDDSQLLTDLEVSAKRAEMGTLEKPYEVHPDEAPTVLKALMDCLRNETPERQVVSPARYILKHVVYS